MFWHCLKNQFKVTLRSKESIFWTIAFPFILSILFFFAFSNLKDQTTFKPIPVALASSQQDLPENINQSIIALSSGDTPILTLKTLEKSLALEELESGKISGIISIEDNQPFITIKDNGFNQTILVTSIDQSLQTSHAILSALKTDPNLIQKLGTLNESDFLSKDSTMNSDTTALYFYTLIGMSCIYAGLLGVSPINPATSLIAGLVSSFIISGTSNILLYFFMTNILGVEFGVSAWAIILAILSGILAGLGFGTVLSAITKQNENIKISLLVGITMLFSFLAGMMGTESIKHAIDQSAPVLAAINPVNLISDALLSTYYLGIGERFFSDIFLLIAFFVVSTVISWLLLRKRSYASL